ncbi:20646_t:CDS:2, partial [Racocetra persica]
NRKVNVLVQKKNRTVREYDEQDDYEQINEELNDHIWVDEEIDERAADYFDILLLAGRNNNVWKTSGRPIVNFGDSGRTLNPPLAPNTTLTCALSDAVALVQSADENREKNIEGIMEGIMERNIEKNMEENRERIMKEIVERNMEGNTEENRKGIIEGNTEENMEKNARESIEKNIANKKARMKLAIEELDNLLKKDDGHMDKGTKVRLQASLQYLWLRHQGWTKIHASATIASSLGWGDYKVVSLIDDERISLKIISYLRSYKFSVNPKVLKEFVENEVFPSLGVEKKTTISERTASTWLNKLGWHYKEWKKEPLLIEYDENDLNKLVEKNIFPNEMPYCVITHNETTLAANDDKKTRWAPE